MIYDVVLWEGISRMVVNREIIRYEMRLWVNVLLQNRLDVLQRSSLIGNDRTSPPRSTRASTGVFFDSRDGRPRLPFSFPPI